MVTLSELAPLAKKLNEKSNELNSVIETINANLMALNLGIEVWASRPIVSGDFEYDYDTQPTLRFRKVVYLGYAEVEDEWQLAIKSVTLETKYQDNEEYEEAVNPDIKPLNSASRQLRTAAMTQLQSLLDRLKQRAEKLVDAIDAGKKAAQSL